MALNTFNQINITNAGLTEVIDVSLLTDVVLLVLDTNLTLSNDVNISTSALPPIGTSIVYVINGTENVDLNGHNFYIEGFEIDESQLKVGTMFYVISQGGDWSIPFVCPTFIPTNTNITTLDGKYLVDGTVPIEALEALTSAHIIVGNSSNVATDVAVTGDISISNTGVTAIASGVIVNADVNASAAIARTKLANGTANHVLINDGSGVMSSEATLAKSRGGFGQSVAASTGIVSFSSGTLNIGAMAEVITIPVSFESGEQCENCVKMPYAGTVVEIYAVCTKAIAGTDDATITAKNNAGTTMTGGVLTFTASDPLNTAYDVSPSANNTFVAGDVLQFVTAKTTSGGKALVSIKVTRNS